MRAHPRLLPCLLAAVSLAGAAQPGAAQRPAPWEGIAPPARIDGLPDLRVAAPLEFSRAWLERVERVRVRREELAAADSLDGLTPAGAAELGAALTGRLRVPVVPLLYAGSREPFPVTALEARLFGPSSGDTVSFRDYWAEVSSGLLHVEGDVAPWVRLSADAGYYLPGRDFGWARFGRIAELREEAILAADRHIDFRSFDNDGPDGIPDSGDDDGFADFVALLYALPCDGDRRAGAIWPHRAAMVPLATADTSAATGQPIRISDYVILPAANPETCGPLPIGVLAHETGHALGLPDLYDYDGSSQGIGAWGLMGSGSHSASFSPAHPDAWSKEQLGWVQVRWIRDSTEIALAPVQHEPLVFRYEPAAAGGRYLLFENRQRVGSDRYLPGHGLLIWEIDPERGALGAWNRDERSVAVRLLQADGRDDLARGRRADAGDPFPGALGRTGHVTWLGTRLEITAIEEREGRLRALVLPARGGAAVQAEREVLRLTALAGGGRAAASVGLANTQELRWQAAAAAPWLGVEPGGDVVRLEAHADSLPPGVYLDTVRISDNAARTLAQVLVSFHVAAPGVAQIVATELPWSWGLAADGGRLLHASYGWDPLGLRPRPRVLELREGSTHPATLARLPADALYAPVIDRSGGALYVLARARGQNYVYRVESDGAATVIATGIGTAAAYGAALLPDGSLLVAEWDGTLHRVTPDGDVSRYAELNANIYQVGTDAAGTVYAASLTGDVVRLSASGEGSVLRTGFGPGRLVALAVTADGVVHAAERGGEGRIVRFAPGGGRTVFYRRPGAHFYGVAVDNAFLYALDLGARNLLRIPLAE